MADSIWGDHGPAHPSESHKLLRRELPHVYVPSMMRESRIWRLLDDTMTNGRPLFIHGLVPGVGAKTLITNYARAFNARALENNDARRMSVLMLNSRATTIPAVLESLASQLKIPISTTEHRRLSEYLTNRILAAMLRQNITTVAITRLSQASVVARAVIAELMLATDPTYHVDLEPHTLQHAARRIGFVLVDSHAPETVFAAHKETLLLLKNRYACVRPLQTLDELAEYIRRSDIGLDDLDLAVEADMDMVCALAELTSGLPAQIHPFLELVDSIAEHCGGVRPTPKMFQAALPFYRRMVDVQQFGTDVHGHPLLAMLPRPLVPPRTRQNDTTNADLDRVGGMSDSARTIAKRKDTRFHAQRQTKATLRKSQTTMADDHAYDERRAASLDGGHSAALEGE